jgi:ribonuclease D
VTSSSRSRLPAEYLDTSEQASKFVADIGRVRAIAVDTEGASYHRFVDRIYLLQLSTATRHAIIDPLRVPGLAGLQALLESPEVEVVFHDADYDLRLLHQDYGWRVTNIFDTRVAAQLLGIRSFGLAALLDDFFGVKLDKKHQRADWSMRPLTDDMLTYAAQDTFHLLELSERLRDALVKRRRWSWAEEEFTRLEGTRWDADDPSTAFLRIKGARDLTRRELARMRELVTWRDAIARSQDRSTFRVVANDVLLDIARRNPPSVPALSGLKGLNPRLVEQRGREVVDALARGNAVPDAELPRFPRAPRFDRDPHFDELVAKVKSARDAAAVRLELDPGVLCPRDRLEAVVRRRPRHVDDLREVPELRRWQLDELGEALVSTLRDAPPAPGHASASPATSPYRDG